MPGVEHRLVRQAVDFLPDARKQQLLVPARQVAAADPALEKHIPAEADPLRTDQIDEASRTMAGNMQQFEAQPAEVEALPFFRLPIDLHRIDLEAETMGAEKIPIGHHRSRFPVAGHLAAMLRPNPCRIDHVVEMPVCQE